MSIKDTEPITPTESYIFISLLEKVIDHEDMASMEVQTKAMELLDLINNI